MYHLQVHLSKLIQQRYLSQSWEYSKGTRNGPSCQEEHISEEDKKHFGNNGEKIGNSKEENIVTSSSSITFGGKLSGLAVDVRVATDSWYTSWTTSASFCCKSA